MNPSSASPSLAQLVGLFARIGVLAFGGGVTAHLLQLLLQRGWTTEEEFLQAVNWCQNLPGPNATNLAAYLGFRHHGVAGAVGCTLALVAPGTMVILALSWGLARVPQAEVVAGALAAVAASAVGLLIGTIVQLAPGALRDRWAVAACVVTFVLVAWVAVATPVVLVAAVALLWWVRPYAPPD